MLVLYLDITQKQKNMLSFIKPLPIIITLVTAFGILMHDTHVDRAATVAVALPAVLAAVGADQMISSNYHTHSERAAIPRVSNVFRSTLPNVQPPRDDTRGYLQNKKLFFGGGADATSLWPSV